MGTDYKKSDGGDKEKRKTKIRAGGNVPMQSRTQTKKFMHDKVLSLCVPRLKSRAKEARLIMEVDNLKSGTILAVLGLLEKADREDIYS